MREEGKDERAKLTKSIFDLIYESGKAKKAVSRLGKLLSRLQSSPEHSLHH